MLNTGLDLNYSFFTNLVCEFLIICKFLLIYIFNICLLLLSITSICVITYSNICVLFLLLYHKSKLLKYIQHKQTPFHITFKSDQFLYVVSYVILNPSSYSQCDKNKLKYIKSALRLLDILQQFIFMIKQNK